MLHVDGMVYAATEITNWNNAVVCLIYKSRINNLIG
jgi:hypothetical protein